MEIYKLDDFLGGWFIGNFYPSMLKNSFFETAVKFIKAGEIEPLHYQKTATEITVVISGKILICGKVLSPKEIISIPPMQTCSFEALEDSILVCIKSPSIPSDKRIE